MAEPGAVVDVRGLEDHSRKLLHQVVLLVRCPGRREAGHLFGLVGPELLYDQVVCLVPGRLDERAVLLDERLSESIRAVYKFVGVAPFWAEFAPVDGCALPVRHVNDLAVADDKVEPAPGAAVRACRRYVFEIHYSPSGRDYIPPKLYNVHGPGRFFEE